MRPQMLDRAIAAIAARQAGVISRDQLVALPLSHTAIAKRIASGRLHPVFPGAYAVGVPAASITAIRVAAMLSTAPSFISNRDAAEEHGLVDYHDSPRARRSDARRDAELRAAGHVVIRVREGEMQVRGRDLALRLTRRLHRELG
jgi:putative AbiEi antitoxin of type IV toxin-antitoxin system